MCDAGMHRNVIRVMNMNFFFCFHVSLTLSCERFKNFKKNPNFVWTFIPRIDDIWNFFRCLFARFQWTTLLQAFGWFSNEFSIFFFKFGKTETVQRPNWVSEQKSNIDYIWTPSSVCKQCKSRLISHYYGHSFLVEFGWMFLFC